MGAGSTASGGANAGEGESSADTEPMCAEAESVRLSKELSPKQLIALDARVAGHSVAETARLAKVDVSTVSRWMNHDARFIAASNARAVDTINAGRVGSVSLIPLSLKAVRDAILNGNGWLALQVLRDAKLTSMVMSAAVTPGDAKKEMKLANQRRQKMLIKQQLLLQKQQQKIDAMKEQIERYEQKKREEDPEYDEMMTEWTKFWSERSRDLAADKEVAALDKDRGEKRDEHERYMQEMNDRISASYLRQKRVSDKRDLYNEQNLAEEQERRKLAEEERRLAAQCDAEERELENQISDQRGPEQGPRDSAQKANPDVNSPPESENALPGREAELIDKNPEHHESDSQHEYTGDDDEDDDAIPTG